MNLARLEGEDLGRNDVDEPIGSRHFREEIGTVGVEARPRERVPVPVFAARALREGLADFGW